MKWVLAILVVAGIAASVGATETFVKVDDQTIRHVRTEEKAEDYTLAALDHEIAGCDNDLARIEAMKAPIAERKAKLEAVKAEAVRMEIGKILEPIVIEEPILEPFE